MDNKRQLLYMILGCLGLGVIFDLLFWNKDIGVSIPIFVVIFYTIFFLSFRNNIKFEYNFAWFLTIPIFGLSITYLIFSNPIFIVLNLLAITFLIVMQTILLTNSNMHKWYEIGFIKEFFGVLLEDSFENIPEPFRIISENIKAKTENNKHGVLIKVIIGLIIAIPFVFIVMGLLSTADQVFGYYMKNIFDIFTKINLDELMGQMIIIFVIALSSSCYLISLFLKNNKEKRKFEVSEIKKFIDPIILTTILLLINAVYIFFTFIQFSYLFGSMNFNLPPNFTYADYARRGFFELVFVTLINLSFLIANINLTEITGKVMHKIINILNSILIVCTFVMLVSAHIRMSLYEMTYGYTYLRILTHAFMIFIFILLIVTLFKVWNEKVELAKLYIIISIIAFLSVNYINIDTIIVEKNIERFNNNKQIDISYLSSLSYDAMPKLLTFLKENPNIDKEYTQSNSREFWDYPKGELEFKRKQLENIKDWQAFNISKFNAKLAFDEYEKK